MTAQPNQSNYSKDLLDILFQNIEVYPHSVNFKPAIEKLEQFIETEKARLIGELEAKLPENPYPKHKGSVIKDWEPIHHAFETAITEVKAILEEYK